MRIVVKHVDNLKSSLIKTKEVIPQYLVYKMTEDNISVSCEIANGEYEKNKAINWVQIEHRIGKPENFTLPVCEVTYEEYKNNL